MSVLHGLLIVVALRGMLAQGRPLGIGRVCWPSPCSARTLRGSLYSASLLSTAGPGLRSPRLQSGPSHSAACAILFIGLPGQAGGVLACCPTLGRIRRSGNCHIFLCGSASLAGAVATTSSYQTGAEGVLASDAAVGRLPVCSPSSLAALLIFALCVAISGLYKLLHCTPTSAAITLAWSLVLMVKRKGAEVKTPAEAVAKARSTRRRHHSPPCSSSEDSSASVPKSTGAAPSTTTTTMSGPPAGPPTAGGKPAGPPPPTPVNAPGAPAASFRVGYGKCSASHDGLTNDGTDGLAYSAKLFCRAPLDHSSSDTYRWTTEGTSWSSTGHTHCTHAAAQCTILHCGHG